MTTGPSEVTTGYVVPPNGMALPPGVTQTATVMALPTQVRRPWRSVARTVFQFGVALLTLIPFLVGGVYQDGNYPVVVTQLLVVVGIATRVMALPQVEKFLQDWLPFLSAAPAAISRKARQTT